MNTLSAIALALPWIVLPATAIVRARRSRSIEEYAASSTSDAPRVSIVIPARNEVLNIERCVRSAMAASYPMLEIIVVDDHSSDGIDVIVRALAEQDPRVRIVVPPSLPQDWFGKQWACHAGASASSGEIIAFFDADTWQAPDLVPRAANAMRARGADLFTVIGTQEMGSFWERMIQPQMFALMLIQFGSTEAVNDSKHVTQKIANGQCIFLRRDVYLQLGGHGAVRDKVAEDLALAQLYFRAGRRTVVMLGLEQLSTRMYRSLSELVAGWGKNIYAGGRDVMPFGAVGRAFYPLLLISPAFGGLLPPVFVALALAGMLGTPALIWGAITLTANLLWWSAVYAQVELSPIYALIHPLGSLVFFYIALRSIVRGSRVRWKERDYIST